MTAHPRAPAVEPLAFDVLVALGAIVRHLRHSPLTIVEPLKEQLHCAGLGHRHMRVLLHIAAADTLTSTELCRQLTLSAPTVSELVNDLAARALITRTPDPRDARRQLLSIAEDHQAAVTALLQARYAPIARALSSLTDEHRDGFLAGLHALNHELAPVPATT